MNWDKYYEICRLRDSGQPAQALEGFALLEPGNDEERATLLLARSECFREVGRKDEMLAAARQALQVVPAASPCRPYFEFCLAASNSVAGNYEEAADGFQSFLTASATFLARPDDAALYRDAQSRLAETLIRLRRFPQAHFILEALEQLASGNELANTLYLKGLALEGIGKPQAALSAYQRALQGQLSPLERAHAHYCSALIYHQEGKLPEALRSFESAAALYPADSPYLRSSEEWLAKLRDKLLTHPGSSKVM